jgi:hypothetical protein
LGGFFHHRFERKKLHAQGITTVLKRMHALSGITACPHRKSLLAFYSKKYYTLKHKEGFDKYWAGVKSTVPAKSRISMCQQFVKDALEAESAEFKEQLAREADKEYMEEMEAYQRMHSLPTQTAEAYHE